MDQYPFEFKITLIGNDVDNFIELLVKEGWTSRAEYIRHQFKEQLDEMAGINN